VHEIEIEEKVQKLGRGESRGSPVTDETTGSNGGATSSGLGSLAAIFARVLRGKECGMKGVYIDMLAWPRGKRSN
jgi:hypothetical protein